MYKIENSRLKKAKLSFEPARISRMLAYVHSCPSLSLEYIRYALFFYNPRPTPLFLEPYGNTPLDYEYLYVTLHVWVLSGHK